MKAMILAAGRGERMRPLTNTTPKPLLKVKGKALIVHHIEKLALCGFKEIIINIDHLGEKIVQALGDGSHWGVKIIYSDERQEGALESAGAIIKALPLLRERPFLVLNGDVWSDYTFEPNFQLHNKLAHLILVPNPEHNKQGDFALEGNNVLNNGNEMFTFSGIGYYSPKLFEHLSYTKIPLAPLLREAIELRHISGELYNGVWHDVGTPQRLQALQ